MKSENCGKRLQKGAKNDMTNSEAIETLRANYPDACYEQLREAVDKAIKALNAQDATGDTISRQAAIEHLKKRLYETALNNDTEHPYYEEMADNRVSVWLGELPTIDPVKHGKWIPFEFGDETWHKCTACGAADQYGTKHISHIPGKFHIVYAIRNYCPKCGAKMDGDE